MRDPWAFILNKFRGTVNHKFSTFILLGLSSLFLFYSQAVSQETRTPWKLDDSYNGPHPETFQKLRFYIPGLVNTVQLEIASKMGLDYQEGFRYPFTIGFVEEPPQKGEYALAYVRLFDDGSGFRQRLNINLDAYDRAPFDFDKVFFHEMSHVVLSDALGSDAFAKLPAWLIEGTALWVANQGEQLTRAEAHRYPGAAESILLSDLEAPRQAKLYPQYYLAIEYIVETKGIGALQNLIRDLVKGQPYREALAYDLGESWEAFQKNVRDFSARTIQSLGTGSPFEKERAY